MGGGTLSTASRGRLAGISLPFAQHARYQELTFLRSGKMSEWNGSKCHVCKSTGATLISQCRIKVPLCAHHRHGREFSLEEPDAVEPQEGPWTTYGACILP